MSGPVVDVEAMRRQMPSNATVLATSAPRLDGYRVDHPAAAHVAIVDATAGLLDLRGRKRFALCGFAETSRHRIPVDDPSWLMVGLNQLYRHLPRWDVMFDVHHDWRACLEGTDHEAWLRSCGIPVVMLDVEPSVPTSVRFPMERVLASGLDYLTSTVAYMLAWAVDHIDREVGAGPLTLQSTMPSIAGARAAMANAYGQYTIGMFGIDLTADTEFDVQRPCVEFWLGRAAARGIGIAIPPESALLRQAWRYGLVPEPDGWLAPKDFDARGAELDGQITTALANVERLAGRREEQLYWRQLVALRQRGSRVEPGTGG